MPAPITASMLYDLVACPHRVTMDIFADPAERDEPNPFVQLLWERGALHEREVIDGLIIPNFDLSPYAGDEKERLTYEAMARGEPLIYGGRIQADDLLGEPDLLRKEENGYIAGDIKSGAGEEGSEDLSKPKKHYAVQMGGGPRGHGSHASRGREIPVMVARYGGHLQARRGAAAKLAEQQGRLGDLESEPIQRLD